MDGTVRYCIERTQRTVHQGKARNGTHYTELRLRYNCPTVHFCLLLRTKKSQLPLHLLARLLAACCLFDRLGGKNSVSRSTGLGLV